jgi:hypothetical protein
MLIDNAMRAETGRPILISYLRVRSSKPKAVDGEHDGREMQAEGR